MSDEPTDIANDPIVEDAPTAAHIESVQKAWNEARISEIRLTESKVAALPDVIAARDEVQRLHHLRHDLIRRQNESNLRQPQLEIVPDWTENELEAPFSSPYFPSLKEWAGNHEPVDTGDEWLLPGIIARGVPGIIVGPAKNWKSFLAMDLAIALASGTEALGQRPKKPVKVLFLEFEDSDLTTSKRLWRLCRGRGINPADLDGQLFISRQPFDFCGEEYAQLGKAMEHFKPDVIILDSMRRTHSLNENDSAHMGRLAKLWNGMCLNTGAAVVVVHHIRKASSTDKTHIFNRIRGSSDILALVRWAVGLEDGVLNTEGNFERPLGVPEQLYVRLVDSVDDKGEQVRKIVCSTDIDKLPDDKIANRIRTILAGKEMTATELRDNVGGRSELVTAARKRLEAAGVIGLRDKKYHLKVTTPPPSPVTSTTEDDSYDDLPSF